MKFEHLLNRHDGDRAYLIGCGPGLDKHEFKLGGKVRVSLNAAGAVAPSFPGVTFNLYTDALTPRTDWREELDANVVEICPRRLRSRFADLDGKDADPEGWNRIHFDLMDDPAALKMSRTELAAKKVLFQGLGSASTAVHLLWLMGVEVVTLIGFDGGIERAKSVEKWRDHLTPEQTRGEMYDRIKKDMVRTLEVLDLTYIEVS
jgi:hypothetical protein